MKIISSLMIKDGITYDYCFIEAMQAVMPLLDKFIVMVATNSTDGTIDTIKAYAKIEPKIFIDNSVEWKGQGKEIYANFEDHLYNNILPQLGITEGWRIWIDADEVLHEDCHDKVLEAINSGIADRYFIRRINVYRKFDLCYRFDRDGLCGSDNVKIARIGERAYPEHEGFNKEGSSEVFMDEIYFYHYGLMRNGLTLMKKAKEFTKDWLGYTPQHVLDEIDAGKMNVDRLSPDNLMPIPLPHPRIMQNWILYHSGDKTRTVSPI
jgi:glycosyltransferase involved in cell wall biosynthesis